MTIHSTRSSRLFTALFLGPLALLSFLIGAYVVVWLHLWYGVLPLAVAGYLGYGAYSYGRDATLSVDGAGIVFIRPSGQPLQCSKAEVTRIDQVRGARGTSEIRFVRHDASVAMKVENTYSKGDLEALATHIGSRSTGTWAGADTATPIEVNGVASHGDRVVRVMETTAHHYANRRRA